jgi:hypothetical protein
MNQALYAHTNNKKKKEGFAGRMEGISRKRLKNSRGSAHRSKDSKMKSYILT